MKKLLPLGILGMVLPAIAFAAYNDVTLGSSAVISVAGDNLTVVGDSNVIESILVEGDSFSFVLQPLSILKVTSQSNRQLQTDASRRYLTDLTCETNNSSIQLSSQSDSNITVSISLKVATCPVTSGSGGSSSGHSGGGGSPTVPAVVATTPALTVTAANPSRVTFTVSLSKGSRGATVKALQQLLNSLGIKVAASGPGSSGQETDTLGNLTVQAIQKFQEKYGIATPGVPGYGNVGPKTRAKLNELSK